MIKTVELTDLCFLITFYLKLPDLQHLVILKRDVVEGFPSKDVSKYPLVIEISSSSYSTNSKHALTSINVGTKTTVYALTLLGNSSHSLILGDKIPCFLNR